MNIWTGIFLLGAGFAVYGLSKLTQAGQNLVTETKGRIHSLDFEKIVFAVDSILKNPSNTELTIQYPFVKIFYKGDLIASSVLKNRLVSIKPLMQTTIADIRIPVSYLKLTGVGAELLQKIQDKTKRVTFQVEIQTQIHLAGRMVPYSKTEDITI